MKQLLGVLLLVGVVLTYWQWVIILIIIVMVVRAFPGAWEQHKQERLEKQRAAAAIVARADEQTAWVEAGDPRGTFGLWPPDNHMYPPYLASASGGVESSKNG